MIKEPVNDSPLEHKGKRYTREKEALMSEGLSCCNSTDLPLRAVAGLNG